ncbi:MAG: hypothetical protein ACT4QE_22480 [Anaerolineales bacterium]
MVHALHEARRVLKPNGFLLDLRPAAVHRQVGLMRAGRYRLLGVMRERFDDDVAANRAVAEVVHDGLFKMQRRVRFECNRTMDSLAEFRAWLDEFVSLSKIPSHNWLLQRMGQALSAEGSRTKIVIRGPLDLRVLTKRDASL